MIKLDISTAVFLYLLFNVVGVLLMWVLFDFRTKSVDFRRDEDYIWHCVICANIYINSRQEGISKCPQCGSYNERRGAA